MGNTILWMFFFPFFVLMAYAVLIVIGLLATLSFKMLSLNVGTI